VAPGARVAIGVGVAPTPGVVPGVGVAPAGAGVEELLGAGVASTPLTVKVASAITNGAFNDVLPLVATWVAETRYASVAVFGTVIVALKLPFPFTWTLGSPVATPAHSSWTRIFEGKAVPTT